jgi:phage-related protein
MKPVRWLGSSLYDIRAFPPHARRDAGHALELLQAGLDPPDQKPISSVGGGVFEIRVRTAQHQHRVMYIAKFDEAIYVLHAFEKKSQKTAKSDLDLARRRLGDLMRSRQNRRP